MKRKLSDRLFFLFVSLVTIVVLSPFFSGNLLGQSIIYVLTAAACISTVYGLRLGRLPMIITVLLGILSVVVGGISLVLHGPVPTALAVLIAAVFYGYLISLLIRYIIKAEEVTADILYGSVCVYLLIGIVFAMIYRFIDLLNPDAFLSAVDRAPSISGIQPDFTYFSFVTLTTLGYGDIQPVSGYARTFAFLEAITGTLYVAILISRLVSLYITHSVMKRRN